MIPVFGWPDPNTGFDQSEHALCYFIIENEFKQCVYLDTNSNSSRRSLSKFVVSKHLWWEFLHGEPCFRLDVLVYMLKCVFCHILL